jgi:hypothetical protein
VDLSARCAHPTSQLRDKVRVDNVSPRGFPLGWHTGPETPLNGLRVDAHDLECSTGGEFGMHEAGASRPLVAGVARDVDGAEARVTQRKDYREPSCAQGRQAVRRD